MFTYGVILACLACASDATSFESKAATKMNNDVTRKHALASYLFALQPLARSAAKVRRSNVNMQEDDAVARMNEKDIRDKIEGVRSVEEICKTMKMISAGFSRKAQAAALATKPFIETLQSSVSKLTEKLDDNDIAEIPLLEVRPVKKVALIVMMADMGLCGGYNSKIKRKAVARMNELTALGIEYEVVAIGKKAMGQCRSQKWECTLGMLMTNRPSAEMSRKVAKHIENRFLAGEIDRAEIIYSTFINMATYEQSIRTLIPFKPSEDGIEMKGDEITRMTIQDGKINVEKVERGEAEGPMFTADTVLEQSPEVLINVMLPLFLNGAILSAMQNAFAAEVSARFASMSAAEERAKELADYLFVVLNRKRQARITTQIMEIVGGQKGIEIGQEIEAEKERVRKEEEKRKEQEAA